MYIILLLLAVLLLLPMVLYMCMCMTKHMHTVTYDENIPVQSFVFTPMCLFLVQEYSIGLRVVSQVEWFSGSGVVDRRSSRSDWLPCCSPSEVQ